MKSVFLLIIAFSLSLKSSYSQQYVWTQKQAVPGLARYSAASFTINGKGYLTTGADFNLGQIYNDTWEYNPVTNAWTQKANFLGGQRYGAAAFSIGNFGYVGTGWSPAATNDFYKYDPALNVWTPISNFTGSARYTAVGFSINNKGYVGFGHAPLQKDLYEYDPSTNAWNQMATFPGTERQSASVFVLNNKAYICCGDNGVSPLNENWEFDPALNSWTQKAPLPGNARYAANSFVMNGFGVVGSGSDYLSCLSDYYIYNSSTDSWCNIPSLPGLVRQAAIGFDIGNKGYVGTGRNNFTNQYYNDLWELKLQSASINYQQIVCYFYEFYSTLPPGTISQTWYFGDGTTSNFANPTHNFLVPGTFNVSLVVNYGCGKDSIVQQVVTGLAANATYTVTTDTCNRTLQISNQSFTGFFFHWNFGDGTTSNAVNPSHTYAAPGTYNVSLIISDDCGNDTSTTVVNFPVINPPVAAFNFLPDNCNLSVAFNNTSAFSSNYTWNFGDGTGSTQVSPTHLYSSPGTYLVTLIAQTGCGIDSVTQSVTVTPSGSLPVSSFTAALDTCTKTVTFTNTSTGATSYSWDFGDFGTSTQSDPVYIYDSQGIYIISLIASNACGSDTSTLSITIPAPVLPSASYTATLDTCSRTISFNNTSGNGTYLWDFGDGTTDTSANPLHTYALSGNYIVTLTVANSCGSASVSTNYLIPDGSPVAAFSLTIDSCALSITANNSSVATSYLWDFGDGATSIAVNPTHTYSNAGTYQVTLIATNSCGVDSSSQIVTLKAVSLPVASFSASLDTCTQTISFTNSSTSASSYLWNFGDSTTSTLTNPTHTYSVNGFFSVLLIAQNSCGVDSISQTFNVPAANTPVASFSLSIDTCSLTITTTNSSNGNSFSWDFGDGFSSTLFEPTHTYSTSGNYLISLVSQDECGSDTLAVNYNIPVSGAPVSSFTTAQAINGILEMEQEALQ
jgi:PKD repeat protein